MLSIGDFQFLTFFKPDRYSIWEKYICSSYWIKIIGPFVGPGISDITKMSYEVVHFTDSRRPKKSVLRGVCPIHLMLLCN